MKISPPKGLPETITIVGVPYSIDYYDNPSECHPDNDTCFNGYIDHAHSRIKVWGTGRPIQSILTTIMHEVVHGIVDRMSLSFQEEGGTITSHPQFTALANGITDTLIRNNLLNPALLESRDGAEASELQERQGDGPPIGADSGEVVRDFILDRLCVEGARRDQAAATGRRRFVY